MIELILASLALQANPYETFNPTLPYTDCMARGLAARLSGEGAIEAGKRVAAFEQTLAECANLRASALANVDLMLSRLKPSGESPGDRISGALAMDVWDKTFRDAALDSGFRWQDDKTGKPGK